MKKRKFLKCVSAAIASLCFWRSPAIPKQYVTRARWSELVGLKVEWGGSKNPQPGCDWEIVSQVPSEFFHKGEWLPNPFMNKWYANPIGVEAEPIMFCFNAIPGSNGVIDLSPRDGFRFYRT